MKRARRSDWIHSPRLLRTGPRRDLSAGHRNTVVWVPSRPIRNGAADTRVHSHLHARYWALLMASRGRPRRPCTRREGLVVTQGTADLDDALRIRRSGVRTSGAFYRAAWLRKTTGNAAPAATSFEDELWG